MSPKNEHLFSKSENLKIINCLVYKRVCRTENVLESSKVIPISNTCNTRLLFCFLNVNENQNVLVSDVLVDRELLEVKGTLENSKVTPMHEC